MLIHNLILLTHSTISFESLIKKHESTTDLEYTNEFLHRTYLMFVKVTEFFKSKCK